MVSYHRCEPLQHSSGVGNPDTLLGQTVLEYVDGGQPDARAMGLGSSL